MKIKQIIKASMFSIGLVGTAVLTGCATHAQISMPAVQQVNHQGFENKTFSNEVFYSQPKPGVFSGGEQLALKPLSEQELSVASANTLQKFSTYISQQLPKSSKVIDGNNSDYQLIVKMFAKHKKGPAYADYEVAKSLGKSLLTFGLGSSEYDIVADFDVIYELKHKGGLVLSKKYTVKDSAEHERAKYEGYAHLNEYAGQMLEKHIILTLNNFFTEASRKL